MGALEIVAQCFNVDWQFVRRHWQLATQICSSFMIAQIEHSKVVYRYKGLTMDIPDTVVSKLGYSLISFTTRAVETLYT